MKTKREYIDLVREYFESTAKRYGVTRMALFGSVVRDEQNDDSDLDIAYEGKTDLFLRIRMKMELEKYLGCKVDLIRLRQDLAGSSFNEELSKDMIYV